MLYVFCFCRGLLLLMKVKREINRRLDADKPLHEIFLEQGAVFSLLIDPL